MQRWPQGIWPMRERKIVHVQSSIALCLLEAFAQCWFCSAVLQRKQFTRRHAERLEVWHHRIEQNKSEEFGKIHLLAFVLRWAEVLIRSAKNFKSFFFKSSNNWTFCLFIYKANYLGVLWGKNSTRQGQRWLNHLPSTSRLSRLLLSLHKWGWLHWTTHRHLLSTTKVWVFNFS